MQWQVVHGIFTERLVQKFLCSPPACHVSVTVTCLVAAATEGRWSPCLWWHGPVGLDFFFCLLSIVNIPQHVSSDAKGLGQMTLPCRFPHVQVCVHGRSIDMPKHSLLGPHDDISSAVTSPLLCRPRPLVKLVSSTCITRYRTMLIC
jgi:hypothetical protein